MIESKTAREKIVLTLFIRGWVPPYGFVIG